MTTKKLTLMFAAVLAFAGEARAQSSIPYRGHLEHNGLPQNGTFTMTFALFAAASGGTALATITRDLVVSAGEFAAELGPLDASVLASPELFLELSVAPQGGSAVTLPSRQKLHSAPRALRSDPSQPFRAQQIEVGAMSIESQGVIRTPAFRIVGLATDNQGVFGSAIAWGADANNTETGAHVAVSTAFCSGRSGCMHYTLPFETHNGTTVLTIEASAYKTTGGLIELALILDPDATGSGTNAGSVRTYATTAFVQTPFPGYQAVIPRSYTDCATPPCAHSLLVVPRGGTGPAVTNVDGNSYLRVIQTEYPF